MSDAGFPSPHDPVVKGRPFVQSADRPEPPPDLILYSVAQIAQLFEWSEETVKDYLRQGHIEGFKLAGRWRVSLTELRAFVARERAGQRA